MCYKRQDTDVNDNLEVKQNAQTIKSEHQDYSNPTNQQDTKQDLNQPIQSEGATAEKAVSMASGKA